jgi:NDP-sugar pyrophosphorylase family protein
MQVVIPMSGFGERFRRAGYAIPKPLIPVCGRPIIGHVVDMFPNVEDVIFICNKNHINEPSFKMEQTIREVCPKGRIVVVEPQKLGPVQAVLSASSEIDLTRQTIINYCDFTCYWNFDHFTQYVNELKCDGAIPAYTGFHPHMLGSTNYAYLKQIDGWVTDIREKKPFTDHPMEEYASSGTYYFRSGKLALDYCRRAVAENLSLNGEFYVSLVYLPMLNDSLDVAVYPLQHFMQWGTPEDLAIFNAWADVFNRLSCATTPVHQAGTIMIPLAGAGSRFSEAGYRAPKPLIKVSGTPMAVQATRDLPIGDRRVFILRRDIEERASIEAGLIQAFPEALLVVLDHLTDGQARTCLSALDLVDPDEPLTIGACDNGVLYDSDKFKAAMSDPEVDIIVWVARGYANAVRQPHMYGWVATDGDTVAEISVKKALADPKTDPVIIGTFTFKRGRDFRAAAERMIERNGRVNGEYYIDACINDAISLGLKAAIFEVDSYISWGTPDELKAFNYWQSCFHKWAGHAYRIELDSRVFPSACVELERSCQATLPTLPSR